MKRIHRLVAPSQEKAEGHPYQEGLQAMWAARWLVLGPEGRRAWFRCHGSWPPEQCPLLRGAKRI